MAEQGGLWCDHCDLPTAACQHSVDRATLAAFDNRKVVREDLVADGPTITASQTSPCPGCTRDIEPGEEITHTEHGWAHAHEVLAAQSLRHRGGDEDVDWGDFA